MGTELTTNGTEPPKAPIQVGSRGIMITSLSELYRFAQAVAASGLAPTGMSTPETIMVAMQLGLELGLSPMSSLQNIGVINGKPGIYGDAALALVESSGLMQDFDEWLESAPGKRVDTFAGEITDTCAAVTMSQRKGRKPRVTRFTWADAKRAKLAGKTGPWTQYPARMMQFRARGFNLRDNFPDVLKGFKTTEELQDYQVDVHKPAEPRPEVKAALPAPKPAKEVTQVIDPPEVNATEPANAPAQPAAPKLAEGTAGTIGVNEEAALKKAIGEWNTAHPAQPFDVGACRQEYAVKSLTALPVAKYDECLKRIRNGYFAPASQQTIATIFKLSAELGRSADALAADLMAAYGTTEVKELWHFDAEEYLSWLRELKAKPVVAK